MELELTPKVRPIRESCDDLSVARDNRHHALLYEVHFRANSRLVDDDVTGLENLELEFCDHVVDEVRVGVSEEWNGGDQ